MAVLANQKTDGVTAQHGEIEPFVIELNIQNTALSLQVELRGGQALWQVGAELDAVAALDETGETVDEARPHTTR